MATKKIYSIVITMNNGATFTVNDSDNCCLASQAFASLTSGHNATVYVDGKRYIIFATQVQYIEVSESAVEVDELVSPCTSASNLS